jgi:dipeptidyl aminopeptidase/acylaminoacyl peptidase
MPLDGGTPKLLSEDRLAGFPSASLVVPRKVVFTAPDGTPIHGQLFEQPGITGKHPAVVFVHGGPPRQMLLGWHYSEYYSNAYATNQYLASRGYVVLSVNYRLGIGYGHDFHHPPHAGPAGAAEYQDVLAGGRYLARLPEVDPRRVGIWGGSYGGFLTAMALAKNSDVFAAGSDLHGVHDWSSDRYSNPTWRYEQGDLDSARAVRQANAKRAQVFARTRHPQHADRLKA